MRALQTHDVFVAMNLINTSGIKEEFQKMAIRISDAQEKGKKVNVKEVGLEFLMMIFGGCANERSEKLIYEFLGGILEKNPEEIAKEDPMQLVKELQGLKEVISVEEWKSFFTSLKGLLSLK